MRNKICRLLAALASVRIQHRFIRDATVDFYLLPEDVLNDAYSAIETASWSTTLNDEERRSIARFALVLESSRPDLSKPDFYDSDAEWLKIREAAGACLREFGFDLEQYEGKQLSYPHD